jgi:hypothetical protein
MAKILPQAKVDIMPFNDIMYRRELTAVVISMPLSVLIVLTRWHFYGDDTDNITVIQSNIYWLFTATYGAALALVLGNANQIMLAAAQIRSMGGFKGEALVVRGSKSLSYDVDAFLSIASTESIAKNIRSMTVDFGYSLWVFVISDFLGFYYAASMGLTNWYPCAEQFFIVIIAILCRVLISKIPPSLFHAS